jgi:hypothetical protein
VVGAPTQKRGLCVVVVQESEKASERWVPDNAREVSYQARTDGYFQGEQAIGGS